MKHFIPTKILHTLYCTLILPYLNYSITIWGNACNSYLDKLIKIQKWAIRSITNSHYRAHTAPLFAQLNLLTIKDIYTLNLGTFMYRFSINDLPIAFKNFFSKRSEVHNYQTRYANNFNVTNNKKCFSDRSTRSSGPILWIHYPNRKKNQNPWSTSVNNWSKPLSKNTNDLISQSNK